MNDRHGISRENLLFLFPQAIAGDESLSALADAAAQIFAARKEETDIPRIFPTLDRQEEAVLDILAKDLKVDWYDYDYPVSAKRSLIQGSVLTHKRLGTVYAVKSALCSLYPDSEVEEWFNYGGENGYFRININVTHSAETGAVLVYPPDEIKRRIETVKRLAAHLESVSYMVKRGLVVGRRIESWIYRVPECGTIRCGTWWMPSTLGWSERPGLEIRPGAEPISVSPELTGTLPLTAIKGYSLCGVLRVGGTAEGYTGQPEEAGTERSGTVWMPSVLGWSERGELTAGAGAEAFATTPELAGTLPQTAQEGYSLSDTLRVGGGAAGYTGQPENAGTKQSGTAWMPSVLGWSERGELAAGAGAEAFAATPEFTGTLPEEAEDGS